MYERQEDNFGTVRDGLLGLSGHDYKPDGLAILRERDRGLPKVTGGLRGCEHVSYSSESKWLDALANDARTIGYFFPYRSDRDR